MRALKEDLAQLARNERGRKALFVSPVMPDPRGFGLQQRGFSHLSALARLYDVELVVLQGSTPVEEVSSLVSSVAVVPEFVGLDPQGLPMPAKPQQLRVPMLSLLRMLLTNHSRSCVATSLPALSGMINRHFQHRSYDLGFFFRLATAGVCPLLRCRLGVCFRRTVFDLDDIESKALSRETVITREKIGLEMALIRKVQASYLSRSEDWCLRHFDVTFVCSSTDRAQLLQRVPGAQIKILPNSVVVRKPLPTARGESRNILFVGTMNYGPNVDGVTFFCREVLPRLRQRMTRPVDVWIVGYNPLPEVTELAEIDNVHVMNAVNSVVPFYEQAHLVVVPIRYGGGTRIKILEALAFERAVVSTTVGAEGLNLVPGKDLLIADLPDEFAGACADLLTRTSRAQALAQQGREKVNRLYSSAIAARALLAAVQ